MVQNSIRVYARLKKEDATKKLASYVIAQREGHEDLTFPQRDAASKCHKYRFRKVFDRNSSQNEIFEVVAEPIINSVINGYNGTILAYGQTGSGKTFAITGSPDRYVDRGIIPRSIQHIFEAMKSTTNQFTVHISYLEIYHEIGHDLLNASQKPSFLEELPRVVLLEDANGEAHLRNLSVLPVSSVQEALRLLFLGDTNRTIAETPMNEYSSRSHCIFTIYVTTRSGEAAPKIRRSKLNLVDLAGSERIDKSNISGFALTEAKHINLSLHYLERVISALNQQHRSHIPYRNSMLTYILRDSISGNSLTAMLATIAVTRRNFEETVTTCRFAQRVACVSTEAVINEEVDPQEEIAFLRNEVDDLRRRLSSLRGTNTGEKLTMEQEDRCKRAVKRFLGGSDDVGIDLDMRQVALCFGLFRECVRRREKSNGSSNSAEIAAKYENVIKEKDEEICTLRSLLTVNANQEKETAEASNSSSAIDKITSSLSSIEREALEVFMMADDNKKETSSIRSYLDDKYELARRVADNVQKCQANILSIRRKLKANATNRDVTDKLGSFLISQQDVYRESIMQLEELRNETSYLRQALEQAEIKLVQKFKAWMDSDSGPERDVFSCLEDCDRFISEVSVGATVGKNCNSPARNVLLKRKDENCSIGANRPQQFGASPPRRSVLVQRQDCNLNSSDRKPSTIVGDGNDTCPSRSAMKDSSEFIEFMKTVPLTGDAEVDDEIFNFYRRKLIS